MVSPLEHPKVRAAVEREEEIREAAFLGLPFPIDGADLPPLPPLTLRNFLRLRLAGNPLVCGGEIEPGQVAEFLYVVTEQTGDQAAYAASLKHLDAPTVIRGLRAYREESLFDKSGGTTDGPSRAYWSDPAALVDIFAREYGWTVGEVMSLPLGVIFQLLRAISSRVEPERPHFNPLSDRALLEATPHV